MQGLTPCPIVHGGPEGSPRQEGEHRQCNARAGCCIWQQSCWVLQVSKETMKFQAVELQQLLDTKHNHSSSHLCLSKVREMHHCISLNTAVSAVSSPLEQKSAAYSILYHFSVTGTEDTWHPDWCLLPHLFFPRSRFTY